MKQLYLCLIGLLLCGLQQLSAQTFYEINYTDDTGNEYVGVMCYSEDETCNLRLADVNDEEGAVYSFDYITLNSEEEEDSQYTIMACEDDDTPIFIWIWDTNKTEEEQMIPYISFKEDDEMEDWIMATSFIEISLNEMTPEYLAQFYNEDEEIYQQICAAYQEIEEENADPQETESAEPTVLQNIQQTTPVPQRTQSGNSCSIIDDRPTLHLVIVANTAVADIGSACRTDYDNITNEMQGIAQSLNIKLKEYDVTGSNYSKSNLEQTLRTLNPAANDVVLFLYTGHGFRFDDQKDVYPMIALTSNDYQPLDGNYVALSEIYNVICQKGARLNIVLSDCCNSKIGERRPLQGSTLFSRGNNNFSRKRLADLFFNAQGSILSTAASPGEYSWCDTAGGMFTLSFIQSLRREISAMNNKDVSWQSVVDNTLRTALQRSSNNAKAQNGLKKMQVVNL